MFFHDFIPSPIIFTIGPLIFHWYGLLFGLAVAVAYFIARLRLKKRPIVFLDLDNLFFWLLLVGLIGARLVDVFYFEWWYFKDHWSAIPFFWQGGLAWQGGLIGGIAAAWLYSRIKKIKFVVVADLLAPSLAIGQAIGRWGNYFNQELFGQPTNWPWGIPIVQQLRPEIYQSFSYFHPVFFYEFIGLLIIGLFLLRCFKSKKTAGWLIAWYLLLSGLLRIILETIRLDEQSLWLGLRAGWWLAGLTTVIGLLWLLKLTWFKFLNKKEVN
ncbi:prolipoprotein diacylglyceryl transferase [Patescibacteria group bacterium]|nr:prolipoprotein diacylglyceryl transferase [Patescibacteria group bacterium]